MGPAGGRPVSAAPRCSWSPRFPREPYWLYLLGYHLAVGLVSSGVFALGVGYSEAAFDLYRFSRTYLTEAVSLAVPALIWLRARASPAVAGKGEAPASVEEGSDHAAATVDVVVDGPDAEGETGR